MIGWFLVMNKRTKQALIISGAVTFLFLLIWIVAVQGLTALAKHYGAYQAMAYIQQSKSYFFIAMTIFYMTVFYYLFNNLLLSKK